MRRWEVRGEPELREEEHKNKEIVKKTDQTTVMNGGNGTWMILILNLTLM